MSDGIAAVMSRISQIRSAIGGGGGGVLGVANPGARFSDALSKAGADTNGPGATKTRPGANQADPLERAAMASKVTGSRTARPLGAKPAGWPQGVAPEAEAYAKEFEAAAATTGVPIEVLLAVAWAESGFNPDAVSSAGAQGMMQLMPATGEGMGVTDPFDAGQNILGGAHYLKVQYERFGSWDLAFAAYNAGPGTVMQYGGIPPYPETRSYVDILNGYLDAMTPTPAAPAASATSATSKQEASATTAVAGGPERTDRAALVATNRGAAALAHQRVGFGNPAGRVAAEASSLALSGAGLERVALSASLSGQGSREVLEGLDITETMALAGLDRRRMELLPTRSASGTVPMGTGLAGTVPTSTVPISMVPISMVPIGTAVEGVGFNQWVTTGVATPTETTSGSPTPTLTSTMAALPESLVALIQRSQPGAPGTQRLTVRLDPPELGRLDVIFEVRGDQVAVVVRPESAGAGQLMSNQRDRIAQALAQQGLHLSGFDVSDGGQQRSPDRRFAPISATNPTNDAEPINLMQLTVDRALRL